MADSKVYLNVPYAEKDAAKALGARWDPAKKKWYAPADVELNSFSKWQTEATSLPSNSKTKAKKGSTKKSVMTGVITYPKDKGFVAYNGELPPWD